MGTAGRRLAKWTTFGVVFALAFGAAEWVSRSRNFLAFYPGGMHFPVLLDPQPGAGPEVRRVLALRVLPVNQGAQMGKPSAYLLPPQNPDAGVFQNNFVEYETEPLGEGHIRVTLRRRADTVWTPWSKAVYEATSDKIVPVFIDGGSRASSPYVSALAALIVALAVRRAGQGLVHAARAPGWRRAWRRLGVARWHEDPWALLVLAPVFYYVSVVTMLKPDDWADSYAYLWRRPLNWYFLTGRCLTQRVVYYLLCGSNLRVIAVVQTLAYGAVALTLYAGLRRVGGPARRLAVAGFVVYLFASYTLNVSAIAVAAEPLFLALAVAFPAVLFFWQRRRWAAASLAVGVPFVLSKNVSPFLAMGLVAIHLIVERLVVRRRPRRGAWAVYGVLAALSAASVFVSQRWDESIDLNAVDNLCQRVLTDAKATQLFHEKYGLPEGDYARQLRGGNANTPLDGRQLYIVSTETMNFRLQPDRYGMVEWVRTKGRRAYMHYLLLDRPVETWREFCRGFAAEAHGRSLAYIRSALDLGNRWAANPFPEPSWSRPTNIGYLATLHRNGGTGFLGFDPLEALQRPLSFVGFGDVVPILGYCAAGVVLLFFLRRRALLEPAIAYLACGLAYFFLSFFGDSAEEPRHLFPAFVLTQIGAVLYLYSLFEIVCRGAWRVGRALTRSRVWSSPSSAV